jgi:hypothetical protein
VTFSSDVFFWPFSFLGSVFGPSRQPIAKSHSTSIRSKALAHRIKGRLGGNIKIDAAAPAGSVSPRRAIGGSEPEKADDSFFHYFSTVHGQKQNGGLKSVVLLTSQTTGVLRFNKGVLVFVFQPSLRCC